MVIKIITHKLDIHYDSDYGIEHKKGWSLAWRGCFYVQFERFLIIGLCKTLYYIYKYSRDYRRI